MHTGSGTSVERFFLDAGVRSEVSIVERRVEPSVPDVGDDGESVYADASASAYPHTNVDVDINLGVVHVHVEYDKDG